MGGVPIVVGEIGIPFDLKIASLSRDGQIIEYVRNIAEDILSKDPGLEKSENAVLFTELRRIFSKKESWSNIS